MRTFLKCTALINLNSITFYLYSAFNNWYSHKTALEESGCWFRFLMSQTEATMVRKTHMEEKRNQSSPIWHWILGLQIIIQSQFVTSSSTKAAPGATCLHLPTDLTHLSFSVHFLCAYTEYQGIFHFSLQDLWIHAVIFFVFLVLNLIVFFFSIWFCLLSWLPLCYDLMPVFDYNFWLFWFCT